MRTVATLAVAVLVAAAALRTTDAAAAAPQVRTQAPGFYRMMLGAFEVTALLDGTHPFPVDDVLTGVAPPVAHRLLADAGLGLPPEGSINAFLVNTGTRLVLIDAGAGVLYGADGGHLIANLRASGYTPEQVDDVWLTHLHRDHVGGVDDHGRRAFPNATVHVARVDADYWLDPANAAKAPDFLQPMFDGAIASLQPYRDAGRFAVFDAGDARMPDGFRVVPTPGHAPGHTAYLVESDGEALLVWGVIVHVAPIQFARPRASVKYDSLPADARAARSMLFADAARAGWWIAAAHIAFPGLGHVRRRGSAYEWVPANYTTAFTKP